MPRHSRLDLADVAQYIVQRGNDRQPRLFADVERVLYLAALNEVHLRVDCGTDRFRVTIEAELGCRAGPGQMDRPRKPAGLTLKECEF